MKFQTTKNIINTQYNLYKYGYQHIKTEDDNTLLYNNSTYWNLIKQENNIKQKRCISIINKKIYIENVHYHYAVRSYLCPPGCRCRKGVSYQLLKL